MPSSTRGGEHWAGRGVVVLTEQMFSDCKSPEDIPTRERLEAEPDAQDSLHSMICQCQHCQGLWNLGNSSDHVDATPVLLKGEAGRLAYIKEIIALL